MYVGLGKDGSVRENDGCGGTRYPETEVEGRRRDILPYKSACV